MPKSTPDRIIDRRFNTPSRVGIVATSGSGTGTSIPAHALSSIYHTGTLDDDQGPQFALLDGTRPFTGDITFVGTQTVDGVDISAHASNASAHHAPVTAGTMIGLSGQQVSIANGSAQYQFVTTGASPFTPVYASLSTLKGNGLTYAAGVLTLGTPAALSATSTDAVAASSHSHSIDGTIARSAIQIAGTGALGGGGNLTADRTISLNTPGTLTVATSNSSATNHTHAITSNSAPGAAASLLASDGTGKLTLPLLVATTSVTTPVLTSSAALALTTSSGNISLDASTDVITIGASNTLKTASYVSQNTGWGIDYAGGADFRYLFTDELHAKSFIADLEQALAGGQIISKSVAVLAVDFTAPAAGGTATLRVKDLPSAANMAVFQSGDIVRLRKFSRASGSLTIADCWGVVTSYADQSDGTQTWTFTRSTSTNAGAMTTGTVINADSIVLDYGTTGNGIYEVNAIDGAYAANSPYWQIVSWSSHPATGQTVNVRGGKLTGITSVANEYGLFAGTGSTASDSYIRVSSYAQESNNLASTWKTGGSTFLSINDTNGVTINTSTAYLSQRAYTFNDGTEAGGLYAYSSGLGRGLSLETQPTSKGSVLGLLSESNSGYTAQALLYAKSGGVQASLSADVSAGGARTITATADSHTISVIGSGNPITASSDGLQVGVSMGSYASTLGSDANVRLGVYTTAGTDLPSIVFENPAGTLASIRSNAGLTMRVGSTDVLTASATGVSVTGAGTFSGKIEGGTGAVSDHLGQALFRYSTQAGISLAATGWGYASHIGFNAYLADRTGSYSASGAWKYVGAQYTGDTTAPGRLTWDGNANEFRFAVAETGLASGADITSWSDVLSFSADAFTWSGNTDNTATFGRAKIGYVGYSDHAGFSHYDMSSAGNYALLQNSTGTTFLNSTSGQRTRFRINNVAVGNLGATGLRVGDDTAATEMLDVVGNAVVSGSLDVDSFAATWSNLTYNTYWSSYGGSYGSARYTKIGDLVMVTGMVKKAGGAGTATVTIGTLPSGYRPTAQKSWYTTLSVGSVESAYKIEVTSGGSIAITLSTTSAIDYVSLDCIQFRTNS